MQTSAGCGPGSRNCVDGCWPGGMPTAATPFPGSAHRAGPGPALWPVPVVAQQGDPSQLHAPQAATPAELLIEAGRPDPCPAPVALAQAFQAALCDGGQAPGRLEFGLRFSQLQLAGCEGALRHAAKVPSSGGIEQVRQPASTGRPRRCWCLLTGVPAGMLQPLHQRPVALLSQHLGPLSCSTAFSRAQVGL